MKISLVVPSYNTPEKVAKVLFDSIAKQKDFDFRELEIVVVDDGSNTPLGSNFFDNYDNLNILYIMSETNVGVGLARQIGINNAHGEYILFADIDDEFYNEEVFARWLLSIEKNPETDFFVSTFIEEVGRDKKNNEVVIPHTNDGTWMHGKLYKKSFLKEKEIYFHPELRYAEDTFFNALAYGMTDNVMTTKEITYIWKRNPESITRANGSEYTYKGFSSFLKAVDLACHTLYERDKNIVEKVVQCLFYVYFTTQSKGWKEHQDIKAEIDRQVGKFYVKYKDAFRFVDESYMIHKFNQERERVFALSPFMEEETFKQFLRRIKRLAK